MEIVEAVRGESYVWILLHSIFLLLVISFGVHFLLSAKVSAHPMLGHRLNRVVHLQIENPEKVTRLLQMLHDEQQKPDEGSEAAVQSLFRLFLMELCRASPVSTEGETEAFNPRMESVRKYLEAHHTEPIRLEQLCELSKLRKANLCRQFKKHTGLTTGDYLKQRRLAAAMQKLRTTNDKVLAIANDCGFSDIAHFNRAFRAAFGQTPSEYRKTGVRTLFSS